MTKTKTTKRALFASILSLLLCVSMLVGSTFAWFTDTATTGVNSIQSGKLDISLQMLVDGEWVDAEGKELGFVDDEGNVLTNILWEPGCSYLLQPFKIVNNGDLTLKFDIVVSGLSGDIKLAEAIEYGLMLGSVDNLSYVSMGELNNFDNIFDGIKDSVLKPGESMDTTADGVTLHMKEDAGNQYQGLKLSGISITVLATQTTAENDSYDDQYDKDAEYPAYASSLAELKTALTNGETELLVNGNIVLDNVLNPSSDLELQLANGSIEVTKASDAGLFPQTEGTTLTVSGNGKIFTKEPTVTVMYPDSGTTLVIEDGTFVYEGTEPRGHAPFIEARSGSHLIIKDGYFDSGYYKPDDLANTAVCLLNVPWGGKITIYGGTFVGFNPAMGDAASGLQGTFLAGQTKEMAGPNYTLPEGYSVIEGETEDGRPTYTINYTGVIPE